ncbi:MAG TPA: hypothetical protein C5S37_02435 [Methanophagales archaeon]|nr:hypothetical protein [Methanophagales archaeon]
MKKRTVAICLFIGCLLIGVVIAGIFRETYRQPSTVRKLTEEEKEEVVKIALNDTKVKEMLKGKEYKVSEAAMISVVKGEKMKIISSRTFPGVQIYIGEDEWMKITDIRVLVDLEKKKVIDILVAPPSKPTMPREVTEEEKEEAIKIALSNESVKEKIEGLEYEIVDVRSSKKWMTGEKLETYFVKIGVKGTSVAYTVRVNSTEGKVIGIGQSLYGDKIGMEKTSKAAGIALNDSRIKEKIEGKEYEVSTHQRLIGKRLVVDIYIDIKEPLERYLATVDTEEWKVIEVWKIAHLFEKTEEIK